MEYRIKDRDRGLRLQVAYARRNGAEGFYSYEDVFGEDKDAERAFKLWYEAALERVRLGQRDPIHDRYHAALRVAHREWQIESLAEENFRLRGEVEDMEADAAAGRLA